RHPRLRIVCTTLLWIALTGVAVRQCEEDDGQLLREVRRLDDRVRALEQRPTFKITTTEEGVKINGNHPRSERRKPDERPVERER
ncbi:MAG: hypothetical protein ACR2RE_15990, partial [Geminicoccaceae bacterium]